MEDDELLVSCAGSVVADLVHDLLERLDTVLVLSDGVIRSSLGSLEETHLTTMGAQTGQVTDLVGDLPHLAVLLHLLLDIVDHSLDVVLDLLDILRSANLVVVVVLARLRGGESELLIPGSLLILLGHVRVVISVHFVHDAHDLNWHSSVRAAAVNLLNLGVVLVENALPILSEDAFDAAYDRSALDNIHE